MITGGAYERYHAKIQKKYLSTIHAFADFGGELKMKIHILLMIISQNNTDEVVFYVWEKVVEIIMEANY